jgi:hypothetical protein
MGARSWEEQEAHDRGVLIEARVLESYGWEVYADLPEWKRPPSIAGHQPDIYAIKYGRRRIVEIETQEGGRFRPT